jgi:putative SOS response-associated peptidase YedK
MCVDIGYKSALGPTGIPKYIKGIKIDRSIQEDDKNKPHISAHSNPACLIVVNSKDGAYIDYCSWGFFLNQERKWNKKNQPIYNARSERILDRAAIWNQYITNRCLVIADGVYEHQWREDKKIKIPHYITFSAGDLMLLPALFNYSTKSFAILTRSGNTFFNQIHNGGPNKNRMPLFLKPEDAEKWITESLSEEEIKKIISYEIPNESLAAHTVFSIRSRTPRPDGKEKNEYFSWESSPAEDSQLSLF